MYYVSSGCYLKTPDHFCVASALTTFINPHRPPPSVPTVLTFTMVLLVTSDNEQFVVDKEVAERSVLIKNMLEGAHHTP